MNTGLWLQPGTRQWLLFCVRGQRPGRNLSVWNKFNQGVLTDDRVKSDGTDRQKLVDVHL